VSEQVRTATLTLSSAQGRWVVLATVLGSGLAGIDATVVNVALPAIGESLDADFTALQWTVTAYSLTLAAFILTGGALGDAFGQRRVFAVGVVWFAVASLACGLAPTAELLVAARALQGVGAALLTPGSLALLQVHFRQEDRARAIGLWSGLSGVATAVGPLLGGWLVDVGSWRLVFLINAPLAVLVVWVVARHVPERPPSGEAAHVDWWGSVLAVVGLGGVTYALISAGGEVSSSLGAGAGVVGVLALLGFLWHEWRTPHPMLPLSLFASRQLSATNAVTFLVYGGLGVVFFLLVLQLQLVSGFGPIAAGTALVPVTVLMLLLSARSGALAARIGPRLQMTAGPLVAALGVALLGGIGPDASYVADVLPGVLVFGVGLALLVAPLTATALAAADDDHAGLASGVNNAVARAGGLVAIAAVPVLAGLTGASYTDPDVFAAGFQRAAWISVAALVAAGLLAAVTIRNPRRPVAPSEPAVEVTYLSHCSLGQTPAATSCDELGRIDGLRTGPTSRSP
jgi:EmrB/QacA subfamily drug resistance transporter